MKVQVRGKNGFNVTDAIEAYAKDKLEKVERYFKEDLEAFVVCKIYKDHHKVVCYYTTLLWLNYYWQRANLPLDWLLKVFVLIVLWRLSNISSATWAEVAIKSICCKN